jgi:hypothetical protein
MGPIYASCLRGYLLTQGGHKGPPTHVLALVLNKCFFIYGTLVVDMKEITKDEVTKEPNSLRRNTPWKARTTSNVHEHYSFS